MTPRFSRRAISALVVLVLVPGCSLVAQGPGYPRYRPQDGATRAARVVEAITRLDAPVGSLRRVLVDTLSGGAVWLQFEPGASAHVYLATTPEAVAARFLEDYAPEVFGIASAANDLHLARADTAADLTHLRYLQRSGEYTVSGGQVVVHVARVTTGYTIQSANGWVVPNVGPPVAPRLGRHQAEVAALASGSGAVSWAGRDTVPVVVPYENGTRLAYLVPVLPSIGEPVVRFVDAETGVVFGQAPAISSVSPATDLRAERKATTRRARLLPKEARGSNASMGYYTSTFGFDWQGNQRIFAVWYNLTTYEMRDNSHAGTAEVRIRSFAYDVYCHQMPIVAIDSLPWPQTAEGKEQVSAIHDVGEAVTHFKTKFNRNGMRNIPQDNTEACVHWPGPIQAGADPSGGMPRLIFYSGISPDGPAAAAQDIVTHEFTHGVTDDLIVGGGLSSGDLESFGLEEALSDYFGARHANRPCVGEDVWTSSPCLEINSSHRLINSTLTRAYRDSNCSGNFFQRAYCVGMAVSSTLWATTQTMPPAGDDETDWAVYDAVRYYMTNVTPFTHAREAIVRAAKDRERNLPIQSLYPIVHELETQFYNRGIGPSLVTASVAETTCGQWVLSASASGTFALAFQSGNGFYQDGGVWNPTTQDLGTFTVATLPAFFSAGTLNGHTGGDGHHHSFRLRFTAASGMVGTLDYYAGHLPYCGSFVVTPTAPGFVTVKTTYQLTGSASDAATSWLWEQDYGAGYAFWANQQNSTFIAYAGQYELDWRLSAASFWRGGIRDSGYAHTQVCIPFSPSCYAVRADERAVASSESSPGTRATAATGDHFGSGLWIAFPEGGQKRLIRMFAFSGQHDSSTAAVPWPNIVERDGGDWTYATSPGVLTLATRREAAGEHRALLCVTGRYAGTGKPGKLALALAADPDLGEAEDDALGYDADLGLVWVRDSASGRHLGYMPLVTHGTARAQQFGAGHADAPEASAEALRLMTAPTRVSSGKSGDVRFLLTAPDVVVRGDGAFDATFALLRATSEADLLDLARATRRDAATLLAGSASETVDAFALRQSLGGSVPASASAAGSTQSAVARLQAEGLTALNYRVPTGQEVTVRIRLYNSRGQLVRTLVDQQVAGGTYEVQWDRLNERGQRAAPGVYVAVMEAGGFRATRKLVITR